jgi:DNA-binding NarL/FixJ family response regulator
MLGVSAEVERVLDAKAQQEQIDARSVVARLRDRIEAVQRAADSAGGAEIAADSAAHLAHAIAMLTRIDTPDPNAWAHAAQLWAQQGDSWAAATARLRAAEAAASIGDLSRAATSLHDAHRAASQLGAKPLLAASVALSQRTRLSLEEASPKVLGRPSIDKLGLTSREAEVLALVAVGRTNRQIGDELYVSEKTASVHVSNILRKLGVTSRVDAAAIAQRVVALSA